MAQVEFHPLTTWCVLPDKPRLDRTAARADRDLYREEFRYLRITRLPAECPPWILGHTLGWTVRSPVPVTMTPLADLDVAVPEGEDARAVSRRTGRGQMWQRESDWIATGATWLRLYDVRNRAGEWEGMFLPNGQGTVEWRLGFAARIPDGYFLMVLPPDPPRPGLDVPVGVIPARTVNAMAGSGGISIAARPTHPVTLDRGDPVARLVLLHPDTLQATTPHSTTPGRTTSGGAS
ncbi:hypothetical protein ACWEKM_39385 [Streptomyces sp. NPDC004752]